MTRRADQPSLALPLREGIHLRLPRERFDDAGALGVDDLRILYWQPQSWWAQSPHNPDRRVKLSSARRAATDLGLALRTLVVEGEEAYRASFAFQPDEARGDWLRTPVEVKKALAELGENVRGVWGDELYRLARKRGIAHRVWEMAWSRFEGARRTRPLLSEDDDRRVRFTVGLIAHHKDLGQAMRGGLSDVSVFWRREEDPDTLLRFRFDVLRRQRVYHLNQIGNWRGRNIDAAIADAIEQSDYGLQHRLGLEAFEAFRRFVREGQTFIYADDGEFAFLTDEDRSQLRLIAEAGDPLWIWIFVQLRSDTFGSERAAVVAPRAHAPEGRLWDEAGQKIDEGLAAYRRLRSEHTLARPWSLVDDLKELVDADVRSRMKKEAAS
jgi:hypothetical protein